MKKLLVIVISVFFCFHIDAKFIREDRAWEYRAVLNGFFDPNRSDQSLTLRFGNVETINDKEYHYLLGHTLSGMFTKNLNDVKHNDFRSFGNVHFYCVPEEGLSWIKGNADQGFYRLFLMREENGLIYVYNDKHYKFTQPMDIPPICFALDQQEEGLPDEFLLYDFNAQIGDSFETLLFISGKPVIANVTVTYRDNENIYVESDIPQANTTFHTEYGNFQCFFMGLCPYLHSDGGLKGFFNDRNEYLYIFEHLNQSKNFDSVISRIFEYYVCDETESGNVIETYHIIPSDKLNPNGEAEFARVKRVEWSDGNPGDRSVDNTVVPVVSFRKENGVVYVKPRPEWIDSETGLPFPEGTELIYSDIKAEDGDTFPTFTVENNVVTRQDKKVFAITSALLPKGMNLDALVFCDDDGNADATARFIDGIGFYGPEAGMTVFNGAKLNNIYNEQGEVIVKGEDVKIPEYVGIYDVTASKDSETIYSIDGLRMNCHRSELPAGFYIINGKKVIVK